MNGFSFHAAAMTVALAALVPAAFGEDTTDAAVLEKLAVELAASAPPAKAGDAGAYASASRKLADSKLLARLSNETILWGGQIAGKGVDPEEHNLTVFDPLVWRAEYLAEFMFDGKHTVERSGKYTVLAMDCAFRNGMDPGDYPYPFWHSARKWQSYQQSRRVLFVFEKDKLTAAYRSADEDAARPTVARAFDGNWHWSEDGNAGEPHVSLYTSLFSKENPHVAALEGAYRKLEAESRAANCMTCHSPDNAGKSKKLIILNYPNQALSARRTLVKELEENLMPPKDEDKGTASGVADRERKARLIESAKNFTAAAEKALEFESQRLMKKE